MPLSNEQIDDMRADLGVATGVFTNDELERLYTRAGDNYDLAVYYGYRQLMADANKLYDYTAGQTTVKHSQVREHLAKMVIYWRDVAAETVAGAAAVVGKTELRYLIDFSYPTSPIENEWESRVDNAS